MSHSPMWIKPHAPAVLLPATACIISSPAAAPSICRVSRGNPANKRQMPTLTMTCGWIRAQWGYIADTAGASIELTVDATSIGREGATHTPLVLNHLKSYEHMGKAGARSLRVIATLPSAVLPTV